MGGMGNQMFQYSLGRLLSLEYNQELTLDLSFLKNKNQPKDFVYRDYDLNIFNINANVIDELPRKKLARIQEHPNAYLVPDIVAKVGPYIKSGFDILLEGYFQKNDYIEKIKTSLRQDFTLKKPLSSRSQDLLEKIKSTESVCLNVRRGDYVDNPNSSAFHGFHGVKYFSEALSSFHNLKEISLYVFSDDLKWCEENIRFDYPIQYIDHTYKGQNFGEYLELMKGCKHFIIPNSTFGWWAAWLNENPQKIVTTPRRWFLNDNASTVGLKPDQWIEIDY